MKSQISAAFSSQTVAEKSAEELVEAGFERYDITITAEDSHLGENRPTRVVLKATPEAAPLARQILSKHGPVEFTEDALPGEPDPFHRDAQPYISSHQPGDTTLASTRLSKDLRAGSSSGSFIPATESRPRMSRDHSL